MEIKPQEYLNKEARIIFNELCKHLQAVDALEQIDSFGLSIMAMDLWMFHEAADKVMVDGPVQITKSNYSQITGYFTVMDKCKVSFLKYSQKFGLSPKDRETMLKFKGHKKDNDAMDDL